MNGEGKQIFKNGNEYNGNFLMNQKSGTGLIRNKEGTLIYEGNFHKDSYHGQGTLHDSSTG